MKQEITNAIWLLLALVVVVGCGGGIHDDPILLLSAEEALDTGKALLAEGKYYKARRHLTHAFEVEPNSRSGREALLLVGDALYLQGGIDNFIKCEAKYHDFLTRFPTSERSDYAQFQVGNCLAARIEKPDRDQQVTRQAIAAFEEMLRLYPTSSYADEARIKIEELTQRLATHELVVADFYLRYGRGRRGICRAAIHRLEGLQRDFPVFEHMDEVLYKLGVAYDRCDRSEEAHTAFLELERDFPDSQYVAEMYEYREKSNKKEKDRDESEPPAPKDSES